MGSGDLETVRANWQNAPTAAAASRDPAARKTAKPAYGPLPKGQSGAATLNDAALETWDAAEAAWMEALEALGSKEETKAKTPEHRPAVDLVLEGMAR